MTLKKNIDWLWGLFVLCMLTLIGGSVLHIMLSHSGISSYLMFMDIYDTFMDYFNPISHAYTADPYISVDRIYPAICYVFYWLISKFIYKGCLPNMEGRTIRTSQDALLTLAMVGTFTILAMIIIMVKYMKRINYTEWRSYTMLFLFFLSTPFMFECERANIIIWPLILLFFFITYMDSENKVLRELSLIALALAAAIKIYPAVFGLMLLKDKKIFASIRCAIYGVLLFILPFGIMGGFDKIPVMINALTTGSNSTILYTGLGFKVNFACTFMIFQHIFTGHYDMWMFDLGTKIAYAISAVSLLSACLTKSKWRCYALLSAIMIGLPGFSFIYCMIFMIIPLVAFFSEEKGKHNVLNFVYVLLFVGSMAPIAFSVDFLVAIPGPYAVKTTHFAESISLLLMTVIINIEVLTRFGIGLAKKIKNK